jgi:hypothetical protein
LTAILAHAGGPFLRVVACEFDRPGAMPQKSGNENQATAHKGDKNATKNMLEKEKNTTSGSTPSSK